MNGTVYIVHCIDTEGPLYEAESVPFDMIKNIFHIEIEPTKENLIKLQNKEIDLGGKEEAVANLVDKNKIMTCSTWDEIDSVLKTIMSDDFRYELPDSKGNGWLYNWFCMDHVGFTGNNPRRRDAGYHNIYDHYNKIINEQSKCLDMIQFHHHPLPFSGNYNDSGTAFWGRDTLNQILARRIIDRMWFPSAFRPGFHTERPDSNWFLEQWIPFDFANQAVKQQKGNQPDLAEGRFGDWRYAPAEWTIYHPSHDNYQIPGSCRRWIARCLNMHARIRQITIDDIREAFDHAGLKGDTLLSFTDHDYKNMIFDINKVRSMIKQVAKEYPKVSFEYVNAVDGMRKTLNLEPQTIDLNFSMAYDESNTAKLTVSTNEELFGPQPFLALKTTSGVYYWDNFDFTDKTTWTYTFDQNTVMINAVEWIGTAANSKSGVTEVVLYHVKDKRVEKKVWNETIL